MDMKRSALSFPRTDPTPIFDAFRGNFSTELLTAAVAYFNVLNNFETDRAPSKLCAPDAASPSGPPSCCLRYCAR